MKRKTQQKKQQRGKKNQSVRIAKADNWKVYIALSAILILSFLVYLPVLNNGLLNWDDDKYIKDNPLIRSIDLKNIFSRYVTGNYHPLTMLTLAIEFKFFGLNATGYHTFNLLLHLLNIALVYYSIFLLTNKPGIALIVSLLFGVHPLHVESVAWASELKDLLYTFFFLASYIFYLKYLKDGQKRFFLTALFLFLFSLLSKAMAASLPVLMILTDYFKGRKINAKTLLEKTPFFLMAIVFGIVAISAQKTEGAVQELAIFTFVERIAFACYGFISYLYKLLLPLNLSAVYPYPVKSGADVPAQYYACILVVATLIAGTFYSLKYTRKIFFGIGFFAITIFLVLQLFPVGDAIMADRYSYIPSIGVFFLMGEGLDILWKKMKAAAAILLSALTIFFSIKTYARCEVWKDDMTLWNDVIARYQTVPVAYINRGNILRDGGNYEAAMKDYNKAIELKPQFTIAYFNRGTLFTFEKRNKEAINDFDRAIQLKPDYVKAYHNRGNVFYNERKYEEAIKDYSKAIELNPDFSLSYFSRGLAKFYSGKKESACIDINTALKLGYQPAAKTLADFCN